jgi:hypothetical protein
MVSTNITQSSEVDAQLLNERKDHYWFQSSKCIFNPTLADMRQADAVERYILQGWLPDKPFIDQSTQITAFGSCFAANISNYLKSRQYNLLTKQEIEAYIIDIGEGLVNTFAIRQQFEWAFENIQPDGDLWYGYKAQHFAYDETIRQNTLEIFSKTDVFILTFGLSEIWYDEPTGAVFWKAVPADKVDPSRHKFRVSTVSENRDNIRAIYDLIRKHRPEAKLICTLSPIPLIATFRPVSCITANMVSKAVLRSALDEVHREVAKDGHFFYWPSYEIVMEGFGASPHGGHYNADRRHANDAMLDYIMRLFEEYYCRSSLPSQSLLDAYVTAKIDTLELPSDIKAAVQAGDRRAVQHLINKCRREDDAPTAELIERYATQTVPLRIDPTDDVVWEELDLVWRQLPGLEAAEPGARVFTTPSVAWDYGGVSDAVRAAGPGDLLLRLEVEALTGTIGVLLIRPDGAAVSDVDQKVRPEDGVVIVDLRVYPSDGPTHVLLRNYDDEGVSGHVKVHRLFARGVRA